MKKTASSRRESQWMQLAADISDYNARKRDEIIYQFGCVRVPTAPGKSWIFFLKF